LSHVTNIVLTFSILEDGDDRLDDLNRFFRYSEGGDAHPDDWYHSPSPLKMTSSIHSCYGGTKALEAPVMLGAYNYLNVEALVRHMRTIPWREPKEVQLFAKGQDDDIFTERYSPA
jgi:hypothetical protein